MTKALGMEGQMGHDIGSDSGPTNELVEELNGYQPVDADLSQAFFESRTQSLVLTTVAAATLHRLVELPTARVVVLTGNAGHGKTHLCAQLVSDLSGDGEFDAASVKVIEQGDGQQMILRLANGKPLRIIKDLSEFSHTEAIRLLREAVTTEGVTVVCANEGRLRYCVDKDPCGDGLLQDVEKALRSSFTDGGAIDTSGKVAVLNLNFQGVAGGGDGESLVEQALVDWLDDPRWRTCEECEAADACPVRFNRDELAGSEEGPTQRRNVIRRVFEMAEQFGTVVTVREMLVVLAHTITGGQSCGTVQERELQRARAKLRDGENHDAGWQSTYLYHQLLFVPQVPEQAVGRSRTFLAMQRLDPGTRALRTVDDALDPLDPVGGHAFYPPVDELRQPPPKTAVLREERDRAHRLVWKFHRRRLLFEPVVEGGVSVERRLGVDFSSPYEQVLAGEAAPMPLRKQLARSLAAMQGIRSASAHNMAKFPLVDPAFVGQRALAADQPGGSGKAVARVISRNAKVVDLKLERVHLAEWGPGADGGTASIRDLVNWTERKIRVTLTGATHPSAEGFEVGLAEFDYLLSVGEGLEARAAFSSTARKILRWVANQTVPSDSDDFIISTPKGDLQVAFDGEDIVAVGSI